MQSLKRILRIARATVHAACGWLAYRLGWHGVSRRQFERVLLLRGADFRAYVHLGRIAFDHGDYAGWRREFEHARRTDPIRFARLRHPIELFEPRLAGTQFEGSTELEGFEAADARATWRALHPHQDPRGFDPRHANQPGFNPLGFNPLGFNPLGFNPLGFNPLGGMDPRGVDQLGNGLIHGSAQDDNRTPDGYGRGTDLPLAPGYDPLTSGQQLDSGDGDSASPSDADTNQSDDGKGCDGTGDPRDIDPLGIDQPDPIDGLFDLDGDDTNASQPPRPANQQTPDASLSRDDFSSAVERRRFQLRRPIDRQEIARCDLNDLARRLSS